MDTCSVWILPEEGATLRGCSGGNENVLCTPTNPNCVQCEGSYCNRNVFPANRRRCLQCSGEASCQGSFAACDLLDPEASCYLVLNCKPEDIGYHRLTLIAMILKFQLRIRWSEAVPQMSLMVWICAEHRAIDV